MCWNPRYVKDKQHGVVQNEWFHKYIHWTIAQFVFMKWRTKYNVTIFKSYNSQNILTYSTFHVNLSDLEYIMVWSIISMYILPWLHNIVNKWNRNTNVYNQSLSSNIWYECLLQVEPLMYHMLSLDEIFILLLNGYPLFCWIYIVK